MSGRVPAVREDKAEDRFHVFIHPRQMKPRPEQLRTVFGEEDSKTLVGEGMAQTLHPAEIDGDGTSTRKA